VIGDHKPSIGMTNAAHMLFGAGALDGDKLALMDVTSKLPMTFAALRAAAMAVAARLRTAGVAPGDRVAILLERGPRSAAAYFGVLACGGAAILINEALKLRQIDYILSHSTARVLLTDTPSLQRSAGGADLGVPIVDMDEALICPLGDCAVAPRVGADMAHIIYTSGSTGMPKGVVISHGNVWAGASAVVDYLGISSSDRIASLLPFSFDYGLNQLLCCVRAGATLVVDRTPVPQRVVQTLYDQSVTVLPAVPPLWLQLLTVRRFCDEPLRSLRVMSNTGGRLPRDAVRKLRTSHPDAELAEFAHRAVDGDVRSHPRPPIPTRGSIARPTAVRAGWDRRTTRHAGYAVSQILRKRIEEVFGWIKAQAGLAKVKVRGRAKAEAVFTFAVTAYNLVRIPSCWQEASYDATTDMPQASRNPSAPTSLPAEDLTPAQTRDFFSSLLIRFAPPERRTPSASSSPATSCAWMKMAISILSAAATP
jgi:hypothetical protein